ncbi:Sec1-like protein like protein [Aduncisulcus paluster]|uniref:Sec1-like protein like protein n=1 Tax=Aduncisulcus paluster TaxID=2918883 RepID=A0ABQ5K1K7_9EUKA|nr:Sec1-like protein like protein [Aduncisulcus paluster]
MTGKNLVLSLRERLSAAIKSVEGVKALILDKSSAKTVSSCMIQKEVVELNVFFNIYLSTLIKSGPKAKLPHLTGIVLIRPDLESVSMLKKELESPKFPSYHIFFSGSPTNASIQTLAQADVKSRVRSVKAKLPHLTGIVLIRPDLESVSMLKKELESPKFPSYHIFFSGSPTNASIQTLAQADVKSRVRSVKVLYSDFTPIMPSLFSLECYYDSRSLRTSTEDVADRLLSVVSCLDCSVGTVRHSMGSAIASDIAHCFIRAAHRDAGIFLEEDKNKHGEPIDIYFVDRKSDPLTPLASDWTFLHTVHEVLGIHGGTVTVDQPATPSSPPSAGGGEMMPPKIVDLPFTCLGDDALTLVRYSHCNIASAFEGISKLATIADTARHDLKSLSKKHDIESLQIAMASVGKVLSDANPANMNVIASNVDKKVTSEHRYEWGSEEQSMCVGDGLQRVIRIFNDLVKKQTGVKTVPYNKVRLGLMLLSRFEDSDSRKMASIKSLRESLTRSPTFCSKFIASCDKKVTSEHRYEGGSEEQSMCVGDGLQRVIRIFNDLVKKQTGVKTVPYNKVRLGLMLLSRFEDSDSRKMASIKSLLESLTRSPTFCSKFIASCGRRVRGVCWEDVEKAAGVVGSGGIGENSQVTHAPRMKRIPHATKTVALIETAQRILLESDEGSVMFQHSPRIQTLAALAVNGLAVARQFPMATLPPSMIMSSPSSSNRSADPLVKQVSGDTSYIMPSRTKKRRVLIFMVGGVCYSEYAAIARLNVAYERIEGGRGSPGAGDIWSKLSTDIPGLCDGNIVIGGNCVVNSRSFLKSIGLREVDQL